MPPAICVALILSGAHVGNTCNNRVLADHDRCRVHVRSLENWGPHTTARKELRALQRKEYNEANVLAELTDVERMRLIPVIIQRQAREHDELIRLQRNHVRLHGDPDLLANERRNRARNERIINMQAAHQAARLAGRIGGAVRIAPPVNELAAFAADNQNVHTTHAVEQTKNIIKKILEIKVPVRYQWNKKECSKTPGHIVMLCKLTPTAAWQMMAKYCQGETIYEMGEGIYGRVLDCVWQFILASPDRDDLTKIVKSEMEDNIGMCAQGNLSRLCNILSGYLDDVVIRESPAEIMGRLISGILETSDITERARRITGALIESKMPIEKWNEWAEPAFDEKIVVINNRVEISA